MFWSRRVEGKGREREGSYFTSVNSTEAFSRTESAKHCVSSAPGLSWALMVHVLCARGHQSKCVMAWFKIKTM